MLLAQKGLCNLKLYSLFLILASVNTGSVSISAFSSFLGIPIEITSSAIGLKVYAIIAGIKKYKPIAKKKNKRRYKVEFFAKAILNSIEVLIYKALTDSYFSHYETFKVNDVLKECHDLKEDIRNLKASSVN